jgi:hypothetical protein
MQSVYAGLASYLINPKEWENGVGGLNDMCDKNSKLLKFYYWSMSL